MAIKSKKPAAPAAARFPRKEASLKLEHGDSEAEKARKLTASYTSNEMAALRVMRGAERKSGYWDSIDVPSLMNQLRDQAAAVNRGDLSNAEAMLMNQATALQSLFARLAERGMSCDQVPGFESNMRMALRAQSQCRATLETLAAIKNPPIVYAKQANIANGPQQVNNGVPASPPRAREEKTIQSNELLTDGVEHGPTLDNRGTATAGGADKELATLGSLDRAKDAGR
ncbi:MAG: hypothetical protein QG662_1889 [Pseudomonadota bacterium]|nr:hypothetical protein [Pseudomonadota bacterium]